MATTTMRHSNSECKILGLMWDMKNGVFHFEHDIHVVDVFTKVTMVLRQLLRYVRVKTKTSKKLVARSQRMCILKHLGSCNYNWCPLIHDANQFGHLLLFSLCCNHPFHVYCCDIRCMTLLLILLYIIIISKVFYRFFSVIFC